MCLFAAKVFARDRQTVIFCFIKNMNGIKKHERVLKELKRVLTVVIYWISCVFYEKNPKKPRQTFSKLKWVDAKQVIYFMWPKISECFYCFIRQNIVGACHPYRTFQFTLFLKKNLKIWGYLSGSFWACNKPTADL